MAALRQQGTAPNFFFLLPIIPPSGFLPGWCTITLFQKPNRDWMEDLVERLVTDLLTPA
jgi:hypothetical protein